MKRSMLAVVLVGSLVVQGTVAGAFVGEPANSNVTNATENTTNASISQYFTDESDSDSDRSATTATSVPAANDENASPTSTAATTESATGTETTAIEMTTTAGATATETATRSSATTNGATATTTAEAPSTTETTARRPTETPPTGTAGTASATETQASTPTEGPGASGPSESPTTGAAASGAAPAAAGTGSGAATGASSGGSVPTAAAGAPRASASGMAGSQSPSGARAAGGPSQPAAGGASQPPASASSGLAGASAGGAASGQSAASPSSAVSPDADFEVRSVDSAVAVGEPGTVSVTIENTGEDATNAVVNFRSQASELAFGQSVTTSRFVGDWEEGENETIELKVQAAPTADAADYPVEATVSYDDSDGNASQSAPVSFGVAVGEQSTDLSVVSVASDVPVGGTGNLSVTLENTGEDATDAVVSLGTLSGDLLFGRTANATRYVGEWDEGEQKTIEVTMRAARTADTDAYPIRASVAYDDPDGNAARLGLATFGVTPESQQKFSLDEVSSDLQVGKSGTVSGTVTNDGPKDATDAVLTVSPNGSRDVLPRQTQYVLGDLRSGESASFAFPVAINATTEPGARQVQYFVQYYDSDGTPLRSEPLDAEVDIGAATDDFAVISSETDLEAGGHGTLTVVLNNSGENITESTVSFQSLSGGVTFGESANTTRYVEEWDAGERRAFAFDVASPSATGGETYPMEVSLRYNDSDGDQAGAGPFSFGVTPTDGGEFRVVSTDSSVPVGDTGPVSVTLENDGEGATEAVVSLQSLSGEVAFGRAANATAFVGEWPTDARRTVTVNATASNESDTRPYPLQASVTYNDSNGNDARAGPFTVGVTPQPQQEFTLSDVRSTLRVGDDGNLTARVTNEGPGDADNVVVQLLTQSETLNPKATDVAIGSLAAGDSTRVSFPVEVSEGAEAGQRQFSFVVEYDNENGDTRRSATLNAQAGIAGERDAFSVVRANDTAIDTGSSGSVTLDVTNNLGTPVTNLDAKAYVNDPLSISSDEAYLSRLAPGATKQITFEVSAAGSASAAEYPLSLDFQYDTQSEDSQLSKTYDVPVEVSASSGGGLLSSLWVMGGLAALLVALGVGWVWSRR